MFPEAVRTTTGPRGALQITYAEGVEAGGSSIVGRLLDAPGGDPLPGANLSVPGTTVGAATDLDGRFRLRLPNGVESLRIPAPGFAPPDIDLRAA